MLYSTITYTWKGNTAFTSPHQLICIFSVDPDFCLQITNFCCSIYVCKICQWSNIMQVELFLLIFNLLSLARIFFAKKVCHWLVGNFLCCFGFGFGFLLLFSMPTFPRYSKFQHWPKSLGGKPPLISWLSLKQHLYVRPNCEELPADHLYWYWTCTCTCHLYLYLGASIVKSCQLTSSNQQPVLPGWQDRRSQRVAEGLRGGRGAMCWGGGLLALLRDG